MFGEFRLRPRGLNSRLVLALWLAFCFPAAAQTLPPPSDPFASGKQRFQFDDQVGKMLLAKLPLKKPVNLYTIGAAEDQSIGDKIQSFLAGHGYQIVRRKTENLLRPASAKLTIQESPSAYFVTLVPGA